MSRLFGNLFVVGGGIFIFVMTVNDTSAFFNDFSLVNLAVRALLSAVIFTVLVCIGNKLINFSYSIKSFEPNFIENIIWFSDVSDIIVKCIALAIVLHILFPILGVVFDTVSGIAEFFEKFS